MSSPIPRGETIMQIRNLLAASALLMLASPLSAAETTSYKYDAKGRLKKVERVRIPVSGTPSTTTTEYTHDKADNRKKVKTTN